MTLVNKAIYKVTSIQVDDRVRNPLPHLHRGEHVVGTCWMGVLRGTVLVPWLVCIVACVKGGREVGWHSPGGVSERKLLPISPLLPLVVPVARGCLWCGLYTTWPFVLRKGRQKLGREEEMGACGYHFCTPFSRRTSVYKGMAGMNGTRSLGMASCLCIATTGRTNPVRLTFARHDGHAAPERWGALPVCLFGPSVL